MNTFVIYMAYLTSMKHSSHVTPAKMRVRNAQTVVAESLRARAPLR